MRGQIELTLLCGIAVFQDYQEEDFSEKENSVRRDHEADDRQHD
jgi:hypothetical protein